MNPLYYSLGSFHLRLETQERAHSKIFEELFRVWRQEPRAENQLAAIVRVCESLKPFRVKSKRAEPIRHLRSEQKTIIRTDSVYGEFDLDRKPFLVQITIRPEQPFYVDYPHYLLVVLNKFLLEAQRLHVHAAAVSHQSKTFLFIGDKGSGKTTLSLAFGQAGATILSEDHVMIHRTDSAGYLVSGCDGYMRLTREAETHFFPEGVKAPVRDFAGTPKKELEVSRYFASLPHVDFQISRIFFVQRRDELNVTRLSTVEAAAQMLGTMRDRHRFTDDNDIWHFYEYLEGLFQQSPTYRLTLPNTLDHLPELIQTIAWIDEERPLAR